MGNVTDLQLETTPGIGQSTGPGTRVQCTKAHLYTNKNTSTHTRAQGKVSQAMGRQSAKQVRVVFWLFEGAKQRGKSKANETHTNALTLSHTRSLCIQESAVKHTHKHAHTLRQTTGFCFYSLHWKKGRRLHGQLAASGSGIKGR